MKLIPDPAPAKPDDYHVYVPGTRWRPDDWDGKPISGMGALHAAREHDRHARRERRQAWKLALTQHGSTLVERHDGTTYRSAIGDYSARRAPLAALTAILLAPFARSYCRHDYRTDHFVAAMWGFSPWYEGGGSWRELHVPIAFLPLPFGLYLIVPRGRPEITGEST